jgi:hypothetical protein
MPRFTADFMICASCHQAGYYRLSRDLTECDQGISLLFWRRRFSHLSFLPAKWTKDDLSQMKGEWK